MRIVVVGAGVVGYHLADRLSVEGHDLTVIDSNPELIQTIQERMNVLAVLGDATLPSVLRKAGAEGADLLISVTQRDSVNVMITLLAAKLGAKKRVVRVRTEAFSHQSGVLAATDIGADCIINSREATTSHLERLVRNPGATNMWEFEGGELALWGYQVSEQSGLIDTRLRDLRAIHGDLEGLIVAINRPDGIVIPSGDDELLAGDHIYFFIRSEAFQEFRQLVHPEREPIQRILVTGTTPLSILLAERLQEHARDVCLVDPNRDSAEAASRNLNKATVLCGDIGDHRFFDQYDFGEVDYFVGLGHDDQTNLVHGLMARKRGVDRVGVLIQEPQLLAIVNTLDIDVVINPRMLIVGEILRHIRSGHIVQVSAITETGAEAREYVIGARSPIVGRPLRRARIPKGAILCALYRGRQFMIPRGDTMVQPNDRVVVLALPDAVPRVERLFGKAEVQL